MRRLVFCLLALCLLSGTVFCGDEYKLRDAVECSPRGGLPNFFKKLKDGKDVTIAYLGGSITAQPGYRVYSEKWFQKKFPKAKIHAVNAAIGGTGSDLGAYRVQQDVLDHKPDLVFVEFAVNDGGQKPEIIIKNMEGIVRQTLKQNPETDILFVYTFAARDLKTLQENKFQRSASAMEELADYYSIPSIHMGFAVAKLIGEGKVLMKAPKAKVEEVADGTLNKLKAGEQGGGKPIPFSKDGVHPYVDTGHKFYMEAIERSMSKIESVGTPGPHKLPVAMDNNCAENNKIVPVEKATLSSGWTEVKKGAKNANFLSRFKTMWMASKPGEKISFKFKGTECMIYDLVGPDCAKVGVTLDGKLVKKIDRMDHYCTYYRIAKSWVGANLKDEVHTVEIEILPEQPDRKKIFAKSAANLKKYEANPEKYDGTTWFIGGIMIVGDIVE